MSKDYEELSKEANKRALNMLNGEGVYSHLYFVATEHCSDRHVAEDHLNFVFDFISDTIRIGLDDTTQATKIGELRELAGRYFGNPNIQSMVTRNLLIKQFFDAAYPTPKRFDPSETAIFSTLIGLGGLIWLLDRYHPDLLRLIGFTVMAASLGYIGWQMLRRRRQKLIDHLDEEIRSGEFNDMVVIGQLKELQAKDAILPSAIFNLLEHKPQNFSQAKLDNYVSSISSEQWREGMNIKSRWQKRVSNQIRGEQK